MKRLAMSLLVLAIGIVGGISYTRIQGSPHALYANTGTRRWILPLNNPSLVPAAKASHMRPDDIVFGIIVRGHARAYPQWIMTSYHLSNDTVFGVPIYIAHCEVCSGAAAFDTGIEEQESLEWIAGLLHPRHEHPVRWRLAEAAGLSRLRPRGWTVEDPTAGDAVIRSMTFRVCGMRAGTLEICDDQTLSRWHPFAGNCHTGYFKGSKLNRIPVFTETWSEWSNRFPDTEVVLGSEETRHREHAEGTPPGVGDPFMPWGFDEISKHEDPDRLPKNALIYGIALSDGSKAVALTLDHLEKNKSRLKYDFEGSSFLIFKRSRYGVVALGLTPEQASKNFEIVQEEPFRIRDRDRVENVWNEAGEPLGVGRERLSPVDGYLTEWYEWILTYPTTIVLD